jgi:hypothetical protein
MNPDSFWSSGIIDVFEIIEGFRQRENEAWQRARFQSYILYCSVTEEDKRKYIYEFLELESDPSPEEIAEIEKKKAEEQINEAVVIYNQVKDYL